MLKFGKEIADREIFQKYSQRNFSETVQSEKLFRDSAIRETFQRQCNQRKFQIQCNQRKFSNTVQSEKIFIESAVRETFHRRSRKRIFSYVMVKEKPSTGGKDRETFHKW